MPTNFQAYKRKKERLAKAGMCPCCDCPKSECDCPANCKGCNCHKGSSNKASNKSFREFSRLYED